MSQLLRRQLLENTWVELFDFILPEFIYTHSLPPTSILSHYIFDNVLNQPWESLIQPPVYKQLSDLDLEIAIIFVRQILENPSFISTLARGSQYLRKSIPLSHTQNTPNNTLSL